MLDTQFSWNRMMISICAFYVQQNIYASTLQRTKRIGVLLKSVDYRVYCIGRKTKTLK